MNRIENLSTDRRRLFEARFRQKIGDLPLNAVPIIRRSWDVPIPLSRAQERLWRIERRHPGLGVYNNPTLVMLEGPLDRAALVAALEQLAARHEVSRTRIREGAHYPEQSFAPPGPLDVPFVDLSHLPAVEAHAEARARCAASVARVFDLEGELERAGIFRVTPTTHLLLLESHHIISDGWSGALLGSELPALYEAQRTGRAAMLAELPLRFADYVVWQRQWRGGAAARRQLDYWRKQLGGTIR